MTAHEIEQFKECFKNISVKELTERIGHFRRAVDYRTITDNRLKSLLINLFTVNVNGSHKFFFVKHDVLAAPMNLYRIRKFTTKDNLGLATKEFASMRNEQAIWAKPSHLATTAGRLNKVNESVLYLSSELTNAMYETNCKVKDCFFAMVYRSRRNMRFSEIHSEGYFSEFDELENAKLVIIRNFLREEFTKFVEVGKEYKYRGSLAIFELFFDSEEIDGFGYPSVKSEHNTGFNVIVKNPKLNSNLTFLGVMICQMLPPDDQSEFRLNFIYDGFLNENDKFDYYSPTSSIARGKFGNFAVLRDIGLR